MVPVVGTCCQGTATALSPHDRLTHLTCIPSASLISDWALYLRRRITLSCFVRLRLLGLMAGLLAVCGSPARPSGASLSWLQERREVVGECGAGLTHG